MFSQPRHIGAFSLTPFLACVYSGLLLGDLMTDLIPPDIRQAVVESEHGPERLRRDNGSTAIDLAELRAGIARLLAHLEGLRNNYAIHDDVPGARALSVAVAGIRALPRRLP